MSRGRKAGQGRFKGGRKALPENDPTRRVNVTVKLPLWLRDWIKTQQVSQGRLIEQALVEQYQLSQSQGDQYMYNILSSFDRVPCVLSNPRRLPDGTILFAEEFDADAQEIRRVEFVPVSEKNRERLENEGWEFNRDASYAWGYNGYEA